MKKVGELTTCGEFTKAFRESLWKIRNRRPTEPVMILDVSEWFRYHQGNLHTQVDTFVRSGSLTHAKFQAMEHQAATLSIEESDSVDIQMWGTGSFNYLKYNIGNHFSGGIQANTEKVYSYKCLDANGTIDEIFEREDI